jgi:hypothetical protein
LVAYQRGANKCKWTVCPPYLITSKNFSSPTNGAVITGGGSGVKFTANNQTVSVQSPSCNTIENNKITTDMTVEGNIPTTDIVFVTDLSKSMNPTSVPSYTCQDDKTCTNTCGILAVVMFIYSV